MQITDDVFPVTAGLITKWEQKSLTLAITGDVRIVRLWDAETELKKQDIPTGADCCTTCIDVDGTGWFENKNKNKGKPKKRYFKIVEKTRNFLLFYFNVFCFSVTYAK